MEAQSETRAGAPKVTVVIPTYARPTQLKACLDGLAKLDPIQGGFEVVVVDDGSPQPVEPSAMSWNDRLALRLIVRERGGPALARNAGAEMARGRYLAFIDDDCVPLPGWLSALVRELDRGPDRLLGGPVINGLPDDPYATATQSITTFAQRYYRGKGGNEPFFTTNNLALSTERFREIGQFETSIRSGTGEDREFCDRWRSRDWPMDYVNDAEVVHSHHLTLPGFIRQHYHYGRGILAVRLIRRRRGEKRVVPEPVSFYWNLILFPLREPPHSHVTRGIALMIVAQLATVVGFFSAAIFDRPYLHARRDVEPGAKRAMLVDDREGAP